MGVIQKIKSLCKDKDRKLLEEYGIIKPDSPSKPDCHGVSQEDLTADGQDLLISLLWSANREKALEILRRVEEEDKKKDKDKKDKDKE